MYVTVNNKIPDEIAIVLKFAVKKIVNKYQRHPISCKK